MTVDIMMPFYGREDHFRTAVLSVLEQTDPDWRLVILDDANPDVEPGLWAAGITDPRVHYQRHAMNMGINRSFQECLDLSRAEWVTVFGCDDVMHPRYVERVRELAAASDDVRMIHPGVGVIDADGEPALPLVDRIKAAYRPGGPFPLLLGGEDFALSVTRGNWMNFPAIAWHGPTVRRIGFRPRYQVVQDLALALDICRDGGQLILDDEVVFDYRRHSSSVSSWRAVDGSRFVEEREFFLDLVDDFRRRGWVRAARAARAHISSRLNAVTRIPGALTHRDWAGIAVLAAHALRP